MFLVVGLGNPGLEYVNTRHNAGFMFVDDIKKFYTSGNEEKKFTGIVSQGVIGDKKCIFIKPQTYMNLSGTCVLQVATFYKINPAKIVVVHDEIDMPFGSIKCKFGGGNAGHNGLKSIDGAIGKNYWRIRIGIGRPEFKNDVSSYVLQAFSLSEQAEIPKIFHSCREILEQIIAGKLVEK